MKSKLKLHIPLLLLLVACNCFTLTAQDNASFDKEFSEILKAKDDTTKVSQLRKLAKKANDTEPFYSKKIIKAAIDVSKNINDEVLLGKCLNTYGTWHLTQSLYDTAEIIYRSALEIALKTHDTLSQANYTSNIGNVYFRKTLYDTATSCYLQAIKIYESINDFKRATMMTGNLFNLYSEREMKDLARETALRTIILAKRTGIPDVIGKSYADYAGFLFRQSSNDSAVYYFMLAIPLQQENNYDVKSDLNTTYGNLSRTYLDMDKYNLADLYADSCLQIAEDLQVPMMLAGGYMNKGMVATALKKYKEAESYLAKCFDIVKEDGGFNLLQDYYSQLSFLYEQEGKYKEGLAFKKLSEQYKDSVNNENISAKIAEMDARYQSEKKQSQINELENTKQIQNLTIQQKNNWLYFSALGILGLCIIVFLIIRNSKRKQQLSEQQIIQLQQEKQLQAVGNILKTQEQERSRIAKDLHDGLGGLLSSIKLNLSTMKGNVIIPEKDVQLFNKSITQLDNAIGEMRRVAHNMMPEALVRLGLSEAVNDYCESINTSSNVKLKYAQLGITQPLEKSTEVILYRVIQELTNNAIKYADAKNIIIQLSKNENILNLTVEDDGQGFDIAVLSSTKGTGLQNVQSRIDYLKGTLTIESEKGKGTTANIELPL